MASRDTEKERQRLLALYAGMSEEELLAVAADWISLTEVAQYALEYELRRRGLEVPIAEQTADAEEEPQAPPPPSMIRRFIFLGDALIAEGILNSAEVECCLIDDNIVRLDWFLSNVVDGVKVWVREDDRDAATELLNQGRIERFEVVGFGEYLQPTCPVCKSIDTSNYDPNRRLAFFFLLLFSPGILFVPRRQSRWRCNTCRHVWNEAEV